MREDYGAEIATQVARRLVIAPHREVGKRSSIPGPVPIRKDPLRDVVDWAREHLDADLSIETLATRAQMSRRTFIRRFEQASGASPGEWVLQARVTEARRYGKRSTCLSTRSQLQRGLVLPTRCAITSEAEFIRAPRAIGDPSPDNFANRKTTASAA